MMLDVVKISKYFGEIYPNKNYVILDNGTVILLQDIDPSNRENVYKYIKRVLEHFEHGNINYYTKWDKNENAFVSFDVPNVFAISFIEDFVDYKDKDFVSFQSRNKLIRDLNNPNIYALFCGLNPIQ